MKGLELMLEPTVGNLDQEFIDKWYSSLKELSVTSMKHIVIFNDKTIKETNDKNNQTDSKLKAKLEKAEYEEIKKLLHQIKPQQTKFYINLISGNTKTLSTNTNLLLKRQI